MNKDEFETKFKEETASAWTWAKVHKNFTLPIAVGVICFLLGAFLFHK